MVVKETIKELGTWANYFDNQYMLFSTHSIGLLKQKIEAKIETGTDRLLIMEVSLTDSVGWLPKTAWEWIKTQKSK